MSGLKNQAPPWYCVEASIYIVLSALCAVDIGGSPGGQGPLLKTLWREDYKNYIQTAIEKFANGGRSLDEYQLPLSASNFASRSPLTVFKDLIDLQAPGEGYFWSETPMSGEECPETLFRWQDFSAIVLQVVGAIQIAWTSCLDEHLGLFTNSDGKPVLKLFWFVSDPGYLR